MPRPMTFPRSLGLACLLLVTACGLLLAATVVQAQAPDRLALSAGLGASDYDLSGTGRGFVAGAQLPWRIAGPLVLEPASRSLHTAASSAAVPLTYFRS